MDIRGWMESGRVYQAAVVLLALFILTIMAPPFLIFAGFGDLGGMLYNLHPYDHQWIYRSQCVFRSPAGVFSIQDCIVQGRETEANISTMYTLNGNPAYNGIFAQYAQNQIGRNKAEKVERNGLVGYKFANDTRDYSIYIPMLAAMLLYPVVRGGRRRGIPSPVWLVLALVPMGIDGTSQMLGFQESTNLMRMLTGAIAGVAMGTYFAALLEDIMRK